MVSIYSHLKGISSPSFGAPFLASLFLAALITGCGGTDNQVAQTDDLPPAAQPMTDEVQSLVDQGNTALRDRRSADALALYRQAMDLAPGHPIPQFGGLMAATAEGETQLADSLRALLAVTAPDLLAMMGPDGTMGGGMGGEMGGAGAMPENPHAGVGGQPPAIPLADDTLAEMLPTGHPAVGSTPPDTSGMR